jgi:uncharacterized integral membrane protein
MKNVVTALLVVAVVVLAVGVASHGSRVDLDYLAGTWHQVSLLSLAAVVAGLLVAVGVLSAVAVDLSRSRERRVLHAELERTYVRLRAAETGSAPAAGTAPEAAAPVATGDAGGRSGPPSGESETPAESR